MSAGIAREAVGELTLKKKKGKDLVKAQDEVLGAKGLSRRNDTYRKGKK